MLFFVCAIFQCNKHHSFANLICMEAPRTQCPMCISIKQWHLDNVIIATNILISINYTKRFQTFWLHHKHHPISSDLLIIGERQCKKCLSILYFPFSVIFRMILKPMYCWYMTLNGKKITVRPRSRT